MIPSGYKLLAQLGAGPDGTAFRARRQSDGETVEIHLLAGARADSLRWSRLRRRLRLARMLSHPAARPILAMDLEAIPPWVILDATEHVDLIQGLDNQLPLSQRQALTLTLDLARVVHAAHRLGLAHGNLTPAQVGLGVAPLVWLDFTQLATREPVLPSVSSDPATLADDVTGIGKVLTWLLGGSEARMDRKCACSVQPLLSAIGGALEAQPGIAEVEAGLQEALQLFEQGQNLVATRLGLLEDVKPEPEQALSSGRQLGRFRILEKLGQGGMGEVYRAQDTSDGSTVAVKILLPEWSRRPEMLSRFHKEARLLAEVQSPYCVNLIELNEDHGVHYLAVEYIAGKDLASLIDAGKTISERFALLVFADICRGLGDAHERGIIHRDIKPDNILLVSQVESLLASADEETLPTGPIAKLSDFGLARHLVESESLHMTRTGSIVGTPLYLSPEQCTGAEVTAASDVYGLGVSLFHLLTGRPPYSGEGPLALIQQHCHAAIPSARAVRPDLSEGVRALIEKAMAKSPAHRPPDALAMLRAIESLLRREPTSLVAHPRLPEMDGPGVLHYDFEWQFASSPAELWPHVSNTERLNRAIHLPAVEWTIDHDSGNPCRHGRFRKLGIEVAWQEHPFEWVEGRRFGVLREMKSGPFRWLVSMVELNPHGTGSQLTHRLRIAPAGILGRAFAAVEVGVKTKRALDRVYRRIDAVVSGQSKGLADPFEEPQRLNRTQQHQLDKGLDALARRGVEPTLTETLGGFLAMAPAQEIARMRPVVLARRLGLEPDALLEACLLACEAGLLQMFWDLLCPLCRIPSATVGSLRSLRAHGRCDACNLDYALDFAGSVEMIFRPVPTIRECEMGLYCVGGPAHSPHVVAQLRLAPGESLDLELSLLPGGYRLRGPQLPVSLEVVVEPGRSPARHKVNLGQMATWSGQLVRLRPGGQVLSLHNPHPHELVVRLERVARKEDAVTAARAASLALFRELFPGETLSPGQLVSVANVTLLLTDLRGLRMLADQHGEASAFSSFHEHLEQVQQVTHHLGGALVKAIGDGALVSFPSAVSGVEAALALASPSLNWALHRGPALVATINDHLDYFGAVVRQLVAMLDATVQGEGLVSQTIMDEPALAAKFGERARVEQIDLPGLGSMVVHRVRGSR